MPSLHKEMRTMKRLILIPLLVLALPLWLSCGGQEGTPSDKAKDEGTAEETEVTMTMPSTSILTI